MSQLNNIRKAFGKFALDQTGPMLALKREKFYKRLIIGAGIAGALLGGYFVYRWFRRDDDDGPIKWKKTKTDQPDYNFDGPPNKEGGEVGENGENDETDDDVEVPDELSGMPQKRQDLYKKYFKSRFKRKDRKM